MNSSVPRYLGVDLGSSFIKGAVLDLAALTIAHIERIPFPEPIRGLPVNLRESDPAQVVAATRDLLERLVRHAPDAAGVVMCSQLSSMAFTTADGAAASNIINWQDQRALLPMPGTAGSYFDEINRRLAPDEIRQLGNEQRPGLPLCFSFWLAENQALPDRRAIAASLPNFVIANLCGCAPKTDLTHAYGHGALNVETQGWHRGVVAKLGLQDVLLPEIVSQGTVLGEARIGSRTLPFFAPVGDYQCSQVGALLAADELSVNISTGSAVIQMSPRLEFGDFQTRPFFDGRFLRTITHIPGGRALNSLIRLLSELGESQGVKLHDPWDYILAETGKVSSTDLRVNPAFYFSAVGDRGSITNAREHNLTVGHLFRAAFEGMADNYARCATRVSPKKDWKRLVFSGGVALRIALLRGAICDRLGSEHRLAASDEDTLLGLLVLSLAFSGRQASVSEAVEFFRRQQV